MGILYRLGRFGFKIYFTLMCHWQVKGSENRPTTGPLIVMSNHISYMDPPAVGCIMNRQVYFMAKEELFSNPVFGWILKAIGVFPVKRGKPDRKAIKNAFQVLEDDKVLGIFPEGTRHKPGKLGRAKAGSIMIALKSKAPILPVGIKKNKNTNSLKISIGKPFTLNKYYDKKLAREERKEVGSFIMNKIKKELKNLE